MKKLICIIALLSMLLNMMAFVPGNAYASEASIVTPEFCDFFEDILFLKPDGTVWLYDRVLMPNKYNKDNVTTRKIWDGAKRVMFKGIESSINDIYVAFVISTDNTLYRLEFNTGKELVQSIKLMTGVIDAYMINNGNFVVKEDNCLWYWGHSNNLKPYEKNTVIPASDPYLVASDVKKVGNLNGDAAFIKNDNTLWNLSSWDPVAEKNTEEKKAHLIAEDVSVFCQNGYINTVGTFYKYVSGEFTELATNVACASGKSGEVVLVKTDGTLWQSAGSKPLVKVGDNAVSVVGSYDDYIVLKNDGWLWRVDDFYKYYYYPDALQCVRISSFLLSGDKYIILDTEANITATYIDDYGYEIIPTDITWSIKEADMADVFANQSSVTVKPKNPGTITLQATYNPTGEKAEFVIYCSEYVIDSPNERTVDIDFSIDNQERNTSAKVEYSNFDFGMKSTLYNHNIARVSSVISAAAYEAPHYMKNSGIGENWRDNNIYRAAEKLGFRRIKTYNYDNDYFNRMSKTDNEDKCGFALSEKYVKMNFYNPDEVTKIVLVAVRGTADKEWYDNFHVIEPGTGNYKTNAHYSFEAAANEIYEKLEEYLKRGKSDETKIWITGHSRGAAVANILAKKVTDNQLTEKENIFAYTFATPNGSTDALHDLKYGATEYKNIWNIVNPEDFVPYVAFSDMGWGFGKWGNTLYLPDKNCSDDYDILYNQTGKLLEQITGEKYNTYPNGPLDVIDFINTAHKTGKTVEIAYEGNIPLHKQWGLTLIDYFNTIADTLTGGITKKASFSLKQISDNLRAYHMFDIERDFADMGAFLVSNTLNSNINDSHSYATYIAWMYSISANDFTSFGKCNSVQDLIFGGRTFEIYNPKVQLFDFKVKSGNGSEIGSVINAMASNSNLDEAAVAVTESGVRVHVANGADVTIEITPHENDSLVMVYSDSTSNENPGNAVYSVNTKKNNKVYINISSSDKDKAENTVSVKNGKEKADPLDNEKIDYVNIAADSQGGIATGSGVYYKGEYVTLTAIGEDVFKGWYIEGKLVSEDETYTFIGEKDVRVVAMFINKDHNLIKTSSGAYVSDWAKSEIEEAEKNNIIPPAFRSTDLYMNIERDEFVEMAVNYYEINSNTVAAEAENQFEDIDMSPYKASILKAYKLGITNGVDDTHFEPDSFITREQAAVMLMRVAKLLNKNTKSDAATDSTVSDWAIEGVGFVTQNKIMNGTNFGFEPKGIYTKEQAVITFYRMYKL